MKINYRLFSYALLTGVFTGCTYVEPARDRQVYAEPPPAPRESYVRREPAPEPQYDSYAAPQSEDSSSFVRSEADFYEPLQPYGRWEVVGSYGRCWIPARVEHDWRPYCNGNWRRTDAGWYFVSAEPWGWATYHYGRWALDARFGWVWVPGVQWAPAWVSWHEGGGYVGWAPLAPTFRVGVVYVPPPRAIVFVEQRHFLEPVRPTTVIVNNTTIINKTVNITNVKIVNKTVINEGPRTTVIEQATGRKVRQEPVREVRHQQEAEVVAKIRGEKNRNQPETRTTRPGETPAPQRSINEDRRPAQAEREKVEAERHAQQEKERIEQRDRQESKRAAEIQSNKAESERRAAAQQDQQAAERRAQQEKERIEQRAQQESQRAAEIQRNKAESERRAAAQREQEQRVEERRAAEAKRQEAIRQPNEQRPPEGRAKQEEQTREERRAAEAQRREAARQQNEQRAAEKRAEQEAHRAEKKKHHPEGTNEVDRTEKRAD